MTNQYRPLKDFAPFKAGERFRDEVGDVLTICDDCESLAWTEIDGEYYSKGLARYAIGDSATQVISLDRDNEEPKIWRETDAFTIDTKKYKVWYNENDGLVHVNPAKPSFLPLEAGKTYQTSREGYFDCIHVEGKYAWLKRHGGNDTAYVWGAETGKAKLLSESWNIVGLEET